MELTGEKVIGAPRQRVYDALHDTTILRQSVPGCQTLNRAGDDRYEATIAVEIGPLKSSFFGTIEIYDEDPPSAYSIRASASGGLVGNASGDAYVALASIDDATTNLAYHIRAEVNGQLAGLDRRQLESAVRALVGEFFARLETALNASRFVAISAPTTDGTGAPVVARKPRAETDPSDETASGASRYALAGATAAPADAAPAAQRLETAAPPKLATAHSTTDALGAPLRPANDAWDEGEVRGGPEPEPAAREPGMPRGDTITSLPRYGQEQRGSAPIEIEPASTRMTPWRWFLVLLGIVAIIALLTGAV